MDSDTMTKKRLPYALFSCILQVLKAFIAGELQLPLTAENLRKLNMPRWHIFPTKRTLEDMGWFKDGLPTPLFEELARTYQSDHTAYLATLQAFLQQDLYSEVFDHIARAHIDLAKASATQIEEVISDYEPHGSVKDMAYLFLSLCREAQLIPALENRPFQSNGKFASKGRQETLSGLQEEKPTDDVSLDSRNGRSGMHQDVKSVRIERHRQYVLELLESLPTSEWEEEDRKWWVDALKSNVELLIKPFVRKDEDVNT